MVSHFLLPETLRLHLLSKYSPLNEFDFPGKSTPSFSPFCRQAVDFSLLLQFSSGQPQTTSRRRRREREAWSICCVESQRELQSPLQPLRVGDDDDSLHRRPHSPLERHQQQQKPQQQQECQQQRNLDRGIQHHPGVTASSLAR